MFDFYNYCLLSVSYEFGLFLASVTDIFSYAVLAVMEMNFVRYLSEIKDEKDRRYRIFTAALFVLNSVNGVVLYNCCQLYIASMLLTYFINIAVPLAYLFTSFKYIETIRKIIPPFMYQVIYISSYIISVLLYIRIFPADFTQTVFCGGEEKVVMVCITLVIHSFLLLLVLKLFKKMMNSKGKFGILYLSIPLTLFLTFFVLLYPLMSDFENVVRYFGGYYDKLQSYFFRFGIITALLSALGTYFLLFQMWRKSEAEKGKELYENMLIMEKGRYEDILKSSAQIKKTKHDIKNMLYSVKAELDNNNFEKSKEKLEEILNNVNSAGDVIESQNRTVDCIVNAKLASISGSAVTVSGDISGMAKINDIDISIILGNILDNAVEATSNIDNGVIKLLFFVKDNYQNILCENTIPNSVLSTNPKLKTSKPQKSLHGLGIKSVENTVASYGGAVTFFEKDGRFCVHIMVPLK